MCTIHLSTYINFNNHNYKRNVTTGHNYMSRKIGRTRRIKVVQSQIKPVGKTKK